MTMTKVPRRETTTLRKNWGWMFARGLFALVFGVLTLVWPAMSLFALIASFAVFAIADGLASLMFTALGGRTAMGKAWPLVVTGLGGIGAGLMVLFWPGLTARVLLYIVAVWAIVRGVTEVVAYFSLRKLVKRAWLIALSGLVSVPFGLLLLLASPTTGILALLWAVGTYAIIAGVVLVGLAVSMRRSLGEERPEEHRRDVPPAEPTPA